MYIGPTYTTLVVFSSTSRPNLYPDYLLDFSCEIRIFVPGNLRYLDEQYMHRLLNLK